MAMNLLNEMNERIQDLEEKVNVTEIKAAEGKRDAESRQERNKSLVEKLDTYRKENRLLKAHIAVLVSQIEKLESQFNGLE